MNASENRGDTQRVACDSVVPGAETRLTENVEQTCGADAQMLVDRDYCRKRSRKSGKR